jgi:hypothetical protein
MPRNGNRWKGSVGNPSIGTETLFGRSRPPLNFEDNPFVDDFLEWMGSSEGEHSVGALNQVYFYIVRFLLPGPVGSLAWSFQMPGLDLVCGIDGRLTLSVS